MVAGMQVFRTNASYARWDEGRKMWGMVLNRTRDICRLVRGLATCVLLACWPRQLASLRFL